MLFPLRIVVTQGHRNTSGGSAAERARTPAICLQNNDGTRDDWYSGTLDGVGRAVMQRHRQQS